MQSMDPAKVTAELKAKWTDHTPVYADLIIRKDKDDWPSQQVISAFKKHGSFQAGMAYVAYSTVRASTNAVMLPDSGSCTRADAQVLDTASSAGRPAVPLAKLWPHVQFISTDLAPSSNELALKYAEAEGVVNVKAQTADAQDLQAFADATFAAVTCTYGLLFMPQFEKALKEAYRVLQPGGLYVATLWAEPEQVQTTQLFIGLAGKLVGSQMATRIIPPGIKHATDLPQHLQEAGFADVTNNTYSHPMQFDMPELVELLVGPHSQFAGMLDKLKAGGRTNIYQEAQQALKEVCEEHGVLKDGSVSLANTAMIFTAVKP